MKSKVWTVLFLVIVVCVSTGMLNAIYTHTMPIIQENQRLKIRQSVLDVFGIPYEAGRVEKAFNENIEVDSQTIKSMTLYKAMSGVAFKVSGSGFWGSISALIALEPDLETIIGLKILENSETPGLGGRITESWFQDQFKGKKVTPELKIVSIRRGEHQIGVDTSTGATKKAKAVNEVDAITGATQTSKAFEKLLNENIRIFHQNMGKF